MSKSKVVVMVVETLPPLGRKWHVQRKQFNYSMDRVLQHFQRIMKLSSETIYQLRHKGKAEWIEDDGHRVKAEVREVRVRGVRDA